MFDTQQAGRVSMENDNCRNFAFLILFEPSSYRPQRPWRRVIVMHDCTSAVDRVLDMARERNGCCCSLLFTVFSIALIKCTFISRNASGFAGRFAVSKNTVVGVSKRGNISPNVFTSKQLQVYCDLL